MKTISRYIMTLALLITAVGGAWAQAPTIYFQQDYSTATVDWTTGTGGRFTPIIEDGYLTVNQGQRQNNGTTLTCTATQGKVDAGKDFTMTFNVKLGASTNQNATAFNIYDAANSAPILSFAEGSAGATAWKINQGTQTATVSAGGGKSLDELSWIFVQVTYIAGENAKTYLTLKDEQNNIIDGFDKTEIPTLSVAGGLGKMTFVTSRYLANFAIDNVLVCDVVNDAASAEPTVDVTTNAASEQDLFTEASFNMPAFDATAEYELVRDMSVQMTATMGDGTDGLRYRVKKNEQGEGYEPAEMDMMQVLALVAVNDGIEQKALTLNQDYFCRIYKLDEQTLLPEGDGVKLADFDFAPGLYALKAFANDGSNYDGETALSNTFKLYDYINITFPKGYSTHYYNESLVLDEIRNSLKFYAVTAVTSEKVTLTEIEGKAIPGGTPFIVYNETAEPITAVMGMLQADDVTSAEQFKGTAEDKIMESQSNCYILRNGDSTPTFRLVEGAGTLPAHRCYIDLGAVARTRSLGFDFGDGTTGIDSVESGELKVDSYYDLQGRKHQGTPQRKGVYVKDGRKVIVR